MQEQNKFCRYECGWGPGDCSARAKHEKKVHKKLFTAVPGPIHMQDGRPDQGSGLLLHGKDLETGREFRGFLGSVIPRNEHSSELSPLTTNAPSFVDDQAEEASEFSDMSMATSEPLHSED